MRDFKVRSIKKMTNLNIINKIPILIWRNKRCLLLISKLVKKLSRLKLTALQYNLLICQKQSKICN